MDKENKRSMCNVCLLPWKAYHTVLCDAQVARAHFLLKGFFATARFLKNRICYQAQEWNIRFCPLCC
jgi:hypothetical protein